MLTTDALNVKLAEIMFLVSPNVRMLLLNVIA